MSCKEALIKVLRPVCKYALAIFLSLCILIFAINIDALVGMSNKEIVKELSQGWSFLQIKRGEAIKALKALGQQDQNYLLLEITEKRVEPAQALIFTVQKIVDVLEGIFTTAEYIDFLKRNVETVADLIVYLEGIGIYHIAKEYLNSTSITFNIVLKHELNTFFEGMKRKCNDGNFRTALLNTLIQVDFPNDPERVEEICRQIEDDKQRIKTALGLDKEPPKPDPCPECSVIPDRLKFVAREFGSNPQAQTIKIKGPVGTSWEIRHLAEARDKLPSWLKLSKSAGVLTSSKEEEIVISVQIYDLKADPTRNYLSYFSHFFFVRFPEKPSKEIPVYIDLEIKPKCSASPKLELRRRSSEPRWIDVYWKNFTPFEDLISYLERRSPDRFPFKPLRFQTNSYGNHEFTIDTEKLPSGKYYIWAEDTCTPGGKKTSQRTFVVKEQNICKTNPLACVDVSPPLEEDFLSCAAGEDGIIDDLEIVEILNAWQKQKDYKGCGVPTDEDYMRALGLWIKRQPVDENPTLNQEFKIVRHGTTEDFLGSCPTTVKNIFSSEDEAAMAFVELAGNYKGREVRFDFFDPQGNLHTTGSQTMQQSSCAAVGVRIRNTLAAALLGQWTVKIYIDDKFQFQDTFTIRAVDTDGDGIPDNQDRCPNQQGSVNNNGCPENRSPIISSLTYEPANPTPDDIIYFVVTASDPDGDPLTYEWYLNGVKQINATMEIVQWTNPSEGNYTMMVMVYDNKGEKAQQSVTFTVQKRRTQMPQITSIGIPSSLILETPTEWQLGFADPEGDVNWVQFEVLRESNWQDDGGWDPQVNGIKQGIIRVITKCRTPGTVNGRIWLRDAKGNQSQYYYYSYQCESGGGAIILRAYYKSECPVCVGDYCYDFPSVKCVTFEWQYGANNVLLFEIKSMYTDKSGYSETLNQVNPVIREYSEMLTEDKKVCVQVRAQTAQGFTNWSNKVCATVNAITPSSRWKPELSNKVVMAKVQIFTLSGKLVYATDWGDPRRLEWDLKDYRNLPIANGVYLVVITASDIHGLIHQEIKKIVVLR